MELSIGKLIIWKGLRLSKFGMDYIWKALGFMLFEDAHLDFFCLIMFRFVWTEFLEFSVNNIFIWWGMMLI